MQIEMLANEPDRCPHCDCTTPAKIRKFSVTGRHVNGQQFETIEYDCGFRVSWSPNFSRRSIEAPCPRSKEVAEQQEEFKSFQTKVLRLLAKTNLPEKLKERVARDVDYWRY